MTGQRQMTLNCNFCAWSRTVNFAAPADLPENAQVVVASMGAAVFDHELQAHMRQAHRRMPGVETLRDAREIERKREVWCVGCNAFHPAAEGGCAR